MISAGSPGLAVLVSAPSTSLLPTQRVTKVGCASIIARTWVRPPRMNWVSGLAVIRLSSSPATITPGTATLLT